MCYMTCSWEDLEQLDLEMHNHQIRGITPNLHDTDPKIIVQIRKVRTWKIQGKSHWILCLCLSDH